MKDGAFLDPSVTACIMSQVKRSGEDKQVINKSYFTYRELEVINELVAGHKDDEIAEILNLSKHTVRSHLKNIFRKLGVSSRSQAVTKVISSKVVNTE
jgi:DNA-binding NarL/FixJ family response regulator